jgi:hypothetical protein
MSHFTHLTLGAAVVGMTCATLGFFSEGPLLTLRRAQAQQPGTTDSSVTAAGVTLNSVGVTLPTGDPMFSGGAEAEAINSNCMACHSIGMVLNQPALSPSVWQQEVDKMRVQYKAPIDPQAVPAIVAYLVAHKGTK